MVITNITLKGLNCAACQKIVEKKVKEINGVEEVNVDLDSGKVEIKGQRVVDNSEIMKVLEGTDYEIVQSS